MPAPTRCQKKNHRLSDLVKNAGGVNDRAYVAGARLERRMDANERKRYEFVLNMAREEAERLEVEAAGEGKSVDLTDDDKAEKI